MCMGIKKVKQMTIFEPIYCESDRLHDLYIIDFFDNDIENILFYHNTNLYNRSTIVYKPEYGLGLETTIKTN